jgi:predicted HTH transcriptional regulator
MTALARNTDLVSSHIAAARIEGSTAAHQRAQAVAAVSNNPGRTSSELAEETGLDRYMLARRLPEALKAGAVTRNGPRADSYTGNPGMVWWPA